MPELTLQEYTREIEGLLERGAYDEGVAHCRHILTEHPKCIEPYRLIGQAAFDREDHKLATDMFTRILSASPSDFVARAGLSVVYDKQGSLKDAVWQMERAYELEPGNAAIQEELRRLYGRRDGVSPERVPLTRGALARLYMNGELYSEAVAELRALLAIEPDRVDLQALLAEALWRDEQRLEASEVALKVLDQMPYCLDANLILGEIWMSGGREEDAEVHLRRALALDPEGKRAAQLFGKSSPIPTQPIPVKRLDYAAPAVQPIIEEAPQWLSGIGGQPEAGEAVAEIPAWLQGIGLPAPDEALAEPGAAQPEITEEVPSWLSDMGVTAPPRPAAAAPPIEEEAPDWLAQLRETAAQPEEAAPTEEAVPDWLRAMQPEAEQPAPAVEEAEPTWLTQLRVEAGPLPGEEVEAAPEAAETPDWLRAVQPEAPIAEQEPSWLAQLHEQVGELPGLEEEQAAPGLVEVVPAPAEAEMPDWIKALKPEGVEQAEPVAEMPDWLAAVPQAEQPVAEETPAWLTEGAAMPSPEDALAFFQQLAAGKEEQLAAQAQAEAEVRMAEITGRAAPAPAKVEAPKPEPVPAKPAPPPAPVKAEEPALPGEGAMPSPEEALAFFQRLTAGKEEQLAAQAQAEAEARMAEITGKVAPAKPAPPAPAKVEVPKVKPTPPPAKPTPPPPTPRVEEPVLPGEGAMPSPEEAMAFFQRLTAGKETELKAQAEVEAEARVAEITGRRPPTGPLPPIPPQMPGPIEPAPVKEVPTFAESIAEWLAAPAAIEAAEAEPTEAMPTSWEAIMQPPPIEAPVPEEVVSFVPPPLPVKIGTGPLGAARQPVATFSGPDWWYQTVEDEEGRPEEEEELVAPVVPTAVPLAQVMPVEEVKPAPVAPPRAEAKPAAPRKLVRGKPVPAAPAKPAVDLDAIMVRLRANPDDPQVLLELARGHRLLGDMNAARAGYDELIRRNTALDDVIYDLESIIEERHDDVDSIRLLGDAHMKAGNLQKALKLYRQALKRL